MIIKKNCMPIVSKITFSLIIISFLISLPSLTHAAEKLTGSEDVGYELRKSEDKVSEPTRLVPASGKRPFRSIDPERGRRQLGRSKLTPGKKFKITQVNVIGDEGWLTDKDRVLVLAPHPDDETIGNAGIMQEALGKNIPVKVAYLTNGDANEVSFLVYKKHPVIDPKAVRRMGELRRSEALNAMGKLGLEEKDTVFLGYPDFGTLSIFKEYWGDGRPYESILTKVKEVPYSHCLSPGAPYTGESILKDLKTVIKDYKPTKIFVTMPVDTNTDHRAFYLFLQTALWDLENEIRPPAIYSYIIHASRWPIPRGYHPDLELNPPTSLVESSISWMVFPLSNEQIEKKRDMISSYKSQIEYNPKFLVTFARKNELFGDYPVIIVEEIRTGPINWAYLDEKTYISGRVIDEKDVGNKNIDRVSFVKKDGFLNIKISLTRRESDFTKVNVFLCPYSKKIPFARMPKFRFEMDRLGRFTVYDKIEKLPLKNAKTQFDGKDIFVHIPLDDLKDPDYIFCSVDTRKKDIRFDATAWRVLEMKSASSEEVRK